jgi:predicted Rossmann-fold nucleotide-binding protein
LLNVAGFYDPFLAQLDHAVARRFLRPEHRSLLIADDDAERLLGRLAALQVPSLPKWIDRDMEEPRETG